MHYFRVCSHASGDVHAVCLGNDAEEAGARALVAARLNPGSHVEVLMGGAWRPWLRVVLPEPAQAEAAARKA